MKRLSQVLIGIGLLSLIWATTGMASDTIKFAVVGPMTGDGAAMGIHEKNGVQIAVDEINAAGGINGKKLEFIVGDDDQNPNLATVVAQKVTSDQEVLFAVGHINSSCSIAALPIYEKAHMALISGSNTNVQLTQMGHHNYFRICTPDNIIVAEIATLGIREFGIKRPAVVWENSDYGKGLRDDLVKTINDAGIELQAEATYLPGVDRDFSAYITKFKGKNVDCVYLMGTYTAAGLFLKQAQTLGLKALMIGSSGMASEKVVDIAGKDAAEGFVVVTPYNPNDKRPMQAKFNAEYQRRFNEKPTEWSSHAYDIVYVVKQAIEKGGTDREKLIEALHKVGYEGITGEIKFDANGDVPNKKQMVLRVEEGVFQSYFPKNE